MARELSAQPREESQELPRRRPKPLWKPRAERSREELELDVFEISAAAFHRNLQNPKHEVFGVSLYKVDRELADHAILAKP
jgi:hypothetical protein